MTALRFHRLATREMRAAHDWYRRRSAATAARFLQAIDVAVARIRRDPESLAVEFRRKGTFRTVRVQRFPYRLIFEQLGRDSVLVVALVHGSRRPGYWRRRK